MNEKDIILEAFSRHKAEFDTALEYLQSLSKRHFNLPPDAIEWRHVGYIGYCAGLLNQFIETKFNQGE